MYRQEQRSRSRRREKPRRLALDPEWDPVNAADLASMYRAHDEGNVQFRKRIYATKIAMDSSCDSGLPLEEKSYVKESRRSFSKKASGAPIKTLRAEEMSKELEIRQPSSGVIARLMGLDAMPSTHVFCKQQKEMGNFQKTSNIGFQEKYVTYDDRSFRMSVSEHEAFKDVFEVVETKKAGKHKNQTLRKGMLNSNESDTDMFFIKQRFTDAKGLSTDERLHSSKEFNDGLQVLDHNKDLFLKFMREPNSLFSKHLHDLKCAPSSQHASHITSKGTYYETSEVNCTSRRNPETCARMKRDAISSYGKLPTSYACQSLREHRSPDKLLKSRYAGRTESYDHPNRIVILKPSLEKAQNMARTVSLKRSHEEIQVGCRRHKEYLRSGNLDLYSERADKHKLSDYREVMGHNTKSSIELAQHVRHTASNGSEKVLYSKFNGDSMDESSCLRSDMVNMKKSEALCWASDHFDECGNSFGASSSVNREARKYLSERWKMTRQFQEAGLSGGRSNTLGEMLALSDIGSPKTNSDLLINQETPNNKVAKNESLATRGCSFGISSNDGWGNRFITDLPTSISRPASSSSYGNPKPSSRNHAAGIHNCNLFKDVFNMSSSDFLDGKFNRQKSYLLKKVKYHQNKPRFYDGGEEDMHSEREIHVNAEELKNRIHGGHLPEERSMCPVLSDDVIADSRHITHKFLVPEWNNVPLSSITYEELVKQPTTLTVQAKDGAFPGYNQKETSVGHPQVGSLPTSHDISEPGSPLSSEKTDRPSPISVLEPLSEEEKPNSGCFKKISADLQELRMQLQLLKVEAADKYFEELVFTSSDEEEAGGVSNSDILQAFRDEEDRDFSYLLDVIIESGVHGSDWNMFFNGFYLAENPIGTEVFDKLEKKYSLLVSWPKAERKLLFALINSVLADIIATYMDLHPWVKPRRRFGPSLAREDFVEEVWQMVVRQQKELRGGNPEEKPLESRWFDIGNDVDMIGREIERMLKEDLLEELVSELILK